MRAEQLARSAATVAAALGAVGCGSDAPAGPPPAAALRVTVTEIAPLEGPASAAFGFGSVWVAEKGGPVLRLDPATGRVQARIRAVNDGIVTTGSGGVWLSDFGADRVRRIDPATDRVVASIRTGPAPVHMAAADGAVWVALHHGNAVQRIDAATNRVTAAVRAVSRDIVNGGPQGVAIAGGRVWTALPVLQAAVAIDASTRRAGPPVATSQEPCGQLAAAGDDLWISPGQCGFRLMHVDARSGQQVAWHQLARAAVGDPLIAGRSLWVTTADGVLHELDVRSGRELARGRIGLDAPSLAPAGHGAFVAAGDGRLVRLEVSRAAGG